MIEDHRQLVRDSLPLGNGIDIGSRSPRHKIGLYGCDRHPGAGIDLVCEATSIPVPDNNYDYVSACHVLEHIPSPKLALVEWARILRPCGHLLLVVPDAEASVKTASYWEHVSWFTPAILKRLVESWLGFQVYKFEARQDLKDGPMIFCYAMKRPTYTIPRLP